MCSCRCTYEKIARICQAGMHAGHTYMCESLPAALLSNRQCRLVVHVYGGTYVHECTGLIRYLTGCVSLPTKDAKTILVYVSLMPTAQLDRFMYAYTYTHTHACICICACMRMCVCMCMCAYVCVFLCVCVCGLYLYICVYVHLYMCICIRACMYTCARAWSSNLPWKLVWHP